jgi:hypothetical protein
MLQTAAKPTKLTILTDGNGSIYNLNQDVFLLVRDGIAQILDFNRGQFYGLDKIATSMVSLVIEKGLEKTVDELTQIYDATAEQLRSDLTQLLENLEQKQLLVATNKQSDRGCHWFYSWREKARQILDRACLWLLKTIGSILRHLLNPEPTPNRLTVELLLILSWFSFRLLRWSRTISLWQHWHRTIATIDPSQADRAIATVDRTVREAAAAKLFLPMVCKERALVGYHLLRTFYGLPATLVIGIDRYPFQVHAWVECDGKVITDAPEHCESFLPAVKYS